MAASNYGNSAKRIFWENLPYWVKRINYSESLLLFRVKSQQYNKHDNSAFLKVLVIIIIINNLFIIDSKCIIKTNKQQVTKKKRYTNEICSYSIFRVVLRNHSSF